jgi:hypothetical protein
MWELLLLGPFYIILLSLTMVIVISGRPISKQFLPLKLNIQRFASWLSPSMIMFPEHVLEVGVFSEGWCKLLHVGRNITYLFDHARSNLSNVHINK